MDRVYIKKMSVEELSKFSSKELNEEAHFLAIYGKTQEDAELAKKLVKACAKAWMREYEERRAKTPKVILLPE